MTHRLTAAFCLFVFTLAASAQVSVDVRVRPLAPIVIVPQQRVFVVNAPAAVQITSVDAEVNILEQVATTSIDIHLFNPSRQLLEAELVMPVPDGAAIRTFGIDGTGAEPTAQILPRDEARRIYDDIVRRTRDPGLLEFIGCNLVRSSVFPVQPGGRQTIHLTYEHVLPADGDRVDYVLPRTESIDYHVPWHIRVKISAKRPITAVYSPSHAIDTIRTDAKNVVATVARDGSTEPGPFRLSYLLERNGVTASLYAYPDPTFGGGYFLLLAGLPPAPPPQKIIKREITLVLDRSGSMQGEKLDQVREAALQILAGLEDGEAFNIILYNEAVDLFADQPVVKTSETLAAARAYLKTVKARGGTNIHDALLEALRAKPVEGTLPLVLFLTDGLPTIGQTSEKSIRALAAEGNPFHRRVFTFGVGTDVNSALLENIAYQTRAVTTFVLPGEDVEVKVSGVFKRLGAPILADPALRIVDANHQPNPARVRDVLPANMPDLFEGDQLVVLGQYVGEKPVTFELSGNYLGAVRTFDFTFNLDSATTRHAFVPRLWAMRKIGVLIDAIRSSGADPNVIARGGDPKMKELVDEIVRLSTEFGILTEYTAFLARDGVDLTRRDAVLNEAAGNFQQRALSRSPGLSSINQDANQQEQKAAASLKYSNTYYNDKMEKVAVSNVQQVNDKAFYLKGNRWIDAQLVNAPEQVDEVVEFGSARFMELAQKLAEEHRAGSIALKGDILMRVDGRTVLIHTQP
ncbi:MAG: VWA domain-containing protein [Planctomycetes bacterium]|nr:VWA domain-containing protein [Planctomycetota bacterium]